MLIAVETPIERTPRVQQIEGLFDLQAEAVSRCEWSVALSLDDRPWSIGLVVGPSGCGKSTIARHLWPNEIRSTETLSWHPQQSVLDSFPAAMSVKDVCALLSSVGFSSPPAWLRPYHVLSTGQKFRVSLARVLAETTALAVVDEFSSVVDRTVAQVSSAALAKTVRQRGQQFIAITCHEDVEEWLQPDWVYRPAENQFSWRSLQQRPTITLDVFRCEPQAWELFRRHHYLTHTISPGAVCFLATWHQRPVAFSSWLTALLAGGGKREHRTVTLPDFQGIGIGSTLSTFCASLWKALGYRATSTTTHPAFTASRRRSPHWKVTRPPGLSGALRERRSGIQHANTRLTAGFEYIGPPMDPVMAHRLMADRK